MEEEDGEDVEVELDDKVDDELFENNEENHPVFDVELMVPEMLEVVEDIV